MFNGQTVVIVGAGASCEFDMPDGNALARSIRDKLSFRFEGAQVTGGDADLLKALELHGAKRGVKRKNFLEAAQRIAEAMPLEPSIDEYIDRHPGDEHVAACAKLAIARSILEAERNSKLYRQDGDARPFDRLSTSWHVSFFKLIKQGIRRGDIHHLFNRLGFIVFNYDRCLEYFLHHAICAAYSVSHEESLEVLEKLPIYHPYGLVGAPGWTEGGLGYGGREGRKPEALLASAEKVRTYTEQKHDPGTLHAMRDLVERANTIIFLGFGFHRQNMELLKPERRSSATSVFATASGISDPNRDIMAKRIETMIGSRPDRFYLEDIKCAPLIEKYSAVLTS